MGNRCKRGLLLALLSFPAYGAEPRAEDGARKEYLLKYRLSVNITRELGTGGQALELTARPSNVREEPKYRSREPLYTTVSLGPNRDTFTLVLDHSKGGDRGHDLLYVDTERTGRISSAQKFSSFLTSSGNLFGPVQFMIDYGQEKSPQWFLFRLSERMEGKGHSQTLTAINAGYYEGVVAFGDQKRRVALVDADGNGVYNDALKGENHPCDRLLIDRVVPDRVLAGAKTQPLGRYVVVGDRYWKLDVAADGSSLAVQPLNKPLGTIRLGQKDCILLLGNEECLLRVQTTNGVARVPVGKYPWPSITIASSIPRAGAGGSRA
jgi:hypothetical protein